MVDDEMPQLLTCKQIKLAKQALSLPGLGISKLNLFNKFLKMLGNDTKNLLTSHEN